MVWVLGCLCFAQVSRAQIFWDFTSTYSEGTFSGTFETTGTPADLQGFGVVTFDVRTLHSLEFVGGNLRFTRPIVNTPLGTPGYSEAGVLKYDQAIQEVLQSGTMMLWTNFDPQGSSDGTLLNLIVDTGAPVTFPLFVDQNAVDSIGFSPPFGEQAVTTFTVSSVPEPRVTAFAAGIVLLGAVFVRRSRWFAGC